MPLSRAHTNPLPYSHEGSGLVWSPRAKPFGKAPAIDGRLIPFTICLLNMNYISSTEDALVDALRNHQSADFSRLYRAYAPALYGVLLRMVNDPIRAEDLLQDAFIKNLVK
ncbi:RNA polymerase sigma factor [Spirosoma pollinicola]|uniref:RNA polymerase sigma factor n=1 Tax=Spirosoma pollinicola TaxID=2057025 RepID=UPI0021D2A4AD|nr:sigma factor [Spirosoma pollinicola]